MTQQAPRPGEIRVHRTTGLMVYVHACHVFAMDGPEVVIATRRMLIEGSTCKVDLDSFLDNFRRLNMERVTVYRASR